MASCLSILASGGWSPQVQAAAVKAGSPVPVSSNLEEQVLQVLRNHPEIILESVERYQKQQLEKLQLATQVFLQEMKADPRSFVGDSPTKGDANQKVVLIEFVDFQCPYCAEVYETLKQFIESHHNQVTLVYKHFPIASIHPEATAAAKAAWAAGQQDKFWPYHDELFVQQESLGEELYIAIAKTLNLDLARFNQDRQGNAAIVAIQQDMTMAKQLGVSGTPFFSMNGEIFSGNVSLSNLEDALVDVVKNSRHHY